MTYRSSYKGIESIDETTLSLTQSGHKDELGEILELKSSKWFFFTC